MTNGNNVFVNDKSFNYDHVFTPETDQEEVFKQVGKPQLDSLLEGNGFRIYDKLFTYGTWGEMSYPEKFVLEFCGT